MSQRAPRGADTSSGLVMAAPLPGVHVLPSKKNFAAFQNVVEPAELHFEQETEEELCGRL